MKVVVIEDEQLTADDLIDTIISIDANIEVVAHLSSVKECLIFFKDNPSIDLIFSDIQLGDGLSFELFQQIAITTPVIFCTAFDEYAIHAFKANGIAYLLKPYSNQAIKDALEHYTVLKKGFSSLDLEKSVEAITQNNTGLSTILVHHKDKIIPLQTKEIALIYIRNESVYIRTFEHQSYLINKSLEELDQKLGENFYRANRQFIVNRKAVKDVSTFLTRKYLVNLLIPFSEQIIVSKEKMTSFIKWLKG